MFSLFCIFFFFGGVCHFLNNYVSVSEGTLLSTDETRNSSDCYADCSNTVSSSQTFASCRFEGMSPHDSSNFDQNQEFMMHNWLNVNNNKDLTVYV